MTKEQFKSYINNFDFATFFNTAGWDTFSTRQNIEVQGTLYTFSGIAEKKNFAVLQCESPDGKIPDAAARKQLEVKVRKLYLEHLLIFTDKNKTEQHWQLPLREEGKLKRLVSFSWHKGQDAEGLFQKLRNIVFTLEEEEIITLADVKERVNSNLVANAEKVTKKFYAEFVKQHDAFLAFITGIDDSIPDGENGKKQWYASLMLNRLMFCYFIQKKGFLDRNIHYLREKLAECKKLKSKNNFYGFYRSFLLELFHNELGKPENRRENLSPVPFGDIPYLNGGLFEEHELEAQYKRIAIKDEAFENIFGFFDEWNWHLDTRIIASGKDINPDVIGYIFEKYINQKEMGAYYTKEDITDYIGKNTIIPFLLDKVKSYHNAPFEAGGGFWQYLQDSGDEYIYDAVKKGGEGKNSIYEVGIPENISIGIDTKKPNLLERRKDWNTPTPEDIGLPTEIWRETVARLQRYFELKQKITKGGIQEINDLITCNLNIRRLIQDYLEQTADKEFIRKFYKALISITVLDPTCGSGAFLFAALNILEPLYEVCIQRMEEFYRANPKGNKDFEDHLSPLLQEEHPSRAYYIFKTIILNNLYGVDLMKEAVEIAKLRLFLKLVAEVDPSRRKKNYGLEPLPDIDFNIRSGNTLVGFATEQQLAEVVQTTEGDLMYKEKLAELESACKAVALSYNHFQKVQMSTNSDTYKEIKKSLSENLKELNERLNRYLADTYGLGAKTQWKSKKEKEEKYQEWKVSHQPFHWFAEFYGIISKGGFDVVIGNPPYVEYSITKCGYEIKNYQTLQCRNLYAFVIEKSMSLMNRFGKFGMIVPIASISTEGMKNLQDLYLKDTISQWHSNYATRPGKLFQGVDMNLTISIVHLCKTKQNNITTYTRWYDGNKNRSFIFELLEYINIDKALSFSNKFPKISRRQETSIYDKMYSFNFTLNNIYSQKKNIFYHSGGRYWRKAITTKLSSHYKGIAVKKEYKELVLCLLNSQLFYWYWISNSNCMDVVSREVDKLPVFNFNTSNVNVKILINELLESYKSNSEKRIRSGKRISTTELNFDVKKSKPIIDEIDNVLAKHYGFTEEELDFIINYDIKYRMGGELEEEE